MTWADNRAPIAALWVLLLAGLSLVIAVGGLGLRDAAEAYGRLIVGRG
jgi:hypothetical protein